MVCPLVFHVLRHSKLMLQCCAVIVTPSKTPKVSIKMTVTVSNDFQSKEVLFRDQKTVAIGDCHFNRRTLYMYAGDGSPARARARPQGGIMSLYLSLFSL